MTTSANFDDLNVHQRLTLFTFALLSQSSIAPKMEAVAEGLFDHLFDVFTTPLDVGGTPLIPLLTIVLDEEEQENEEEHTLSAILDAEGNVAPILPHDSECLPLIVSPLAILPEPGQDKNPYTILGCQHYGELHGESPRRLLILAEINETAAEFYGTEPMLVFLDFDLAEEDAPQLHELPRDLADCLAGLLPRPQQRPRLHAC